MDQDNERSEDRIKVLDRYHRCPPFVLPSCSQFTYHHSSRSSMFSSSSLWIFLSIFWSVYFFFFCLIIIFFQRFLELLHKFSVTFTFLKYLSLWINIQKCINIFTKWIPAQKAIVLSHELIIIITRGKTVTSQQGDLAVTIFTTRSKSTSPLCASYTGH